MNHKVRQKKKKGDKLDWDESFTITLLKLFLFYQMKCKTIKSPKNMSESECSQSWLSPCISGKQKKLYFLTSFGAATEKCLRSDKDTNRRVFKLQRFFNLVTWSGLQFLFAQRSSAAFIQNTFHIDAKALNDVWRGHESASWSILIKNSCLVAKESQGWHWTVWKKLERKEASQNRRA